MRSAFLLTEALIINLVGIGWYETWKGGMMETVNLEKLVYRTGLYLPIEVDRYVGLPDNTTAR